MSFMKATANIRINGKKLKSSLKYGIKHRCSILLLLLNIVLEILIIRQGKEIEGIHNGKEVRLFFFFFADGMILYL